MNDRTLLELAAKAAGMVGWRYSGGMGMLKMIDPSRAEDTGSIGPNWNPLTDDADALRLAVVVQLDIHFYHERASVWWPDNTDSYDEEYNDDPCAATRRAIVRAAAEIGKGMA